LTCAEGSDGPSLFSKGREGFQRSRALARNPRASRARIESCLSRVVDAFALDALQKKKKKKKTPHQTGDPEDPDEESNVVSMSSDGRTPAVSDSARRSETTPSIAENT